MSLKTDRINTQILREVSLILQNEVRDRDLRMCTTIPSRIKRIPQFLLIEPSVT